MAYTEKDFNNDLNALDGEFRAAMIKQAKDLTQAGREQIKDKNFASEKKGSLREFGAMEPKTAAASCPGGKIRSEGKGRGMGTGKAKGPIGVPMAVRQMAKKKKKTAAQTIFGMPKAIQQTEKIPANIAKSPKTSEAEMKKVLNLQQAMKAQKKKTAAEQPEATFAEQHPGAAAALLGVKTPSEIKGRLAERGALEEAPWDVRHPYLTAWGGGIGAGALGGAVGGALGRGPGAWMGARLGAAGGAVTAPVITSLRGKKLLEEARGPGSALAKTSAEQPGPLTATLGEKGETVGAAAGLLTGLALGAHKGGSMGAVIGGLGGTLGGAALGRMAGGTAEVLSRETEPGPYSLQKRKTKKAFLINNEKIAVGEGSAAEEVGLSSYAGESAEHDQDAARDLMRERPETRTSEHNQQVANPPKTTDKVVKEGQYGPYGAGARMDPRVAYMMQMMAARRREPTTGEKIKGWLQKHPEVYPLAGAALGGAAGGVLGHYADQPGATVGGAGLGAALGAAGGTMYGKKHAALKDVKATVEEVKKPKKQETPPAIEESLSSEKNAEFVIGGVKIAKEQKFKPGNVSKKDLKAVYEKMVRTGKSPARRTFTWDVGDLVGRKKGKEEYRPSTMVAMRVARPSYRKTAAEFPPNPMMEGGEARYTVGPTPEDVAEYLRTQQAGKRVGALTGLGLGTVGGGALGHAGGGALARGLGGGPGTETAGEILGTILGAGAGGYAGGRLGAPVGEAAGGLLAEHTTPAAQIEAPYMSPQRSEEIAKRLNMAAMLRGGRTPTTAISRG